MSDKTRDRENMPEISAAAFNTLSKHKLPIMHPIKQDIKSSRVKICTSCNQTYNHTATLLLTKSWLRAANFNYDNKCLKCIKLESKALKQASTDNLKELKQSFDEITEHYLAIQASYQHHLANYKALDYQEQMIKAHLTKPVAKKSTEKKPKEKTPEQIKKETALKILSKLSPEQRSVIMANLDK